MNKRIRNLAIIIAAAAAALALLLVITGAFVPGHGPKYSVTSVTAAETPLTGRTIYWLGSSVTLGMESRDEAVADFIAARNGASCLKEAVSGTTLIDEPYVKYLVFSYDSYVTRLKNSTVFDKSAKVDAFVCQISTNDAKAENVPKWGSLTGPEVTDKDAFDVKTTLGAMEYVVAYVSETWGCPIYFYSGAHFDDEGPRGSKNPTGTDYGKLVAQVKALAEKWNKVPGVKVYVIDLFNDAEFNNITDAQYKLYMHDAVHPLRAGYLEWWTPRFERFFTETLAQ